MFFFDSHFGAACLRRSNPSFREVADLLFVSCRKIFTAYQNLLAKQVYAIKERERERERECKIISNSP